MPEPLGHDEPLRVLVIGAGKMGACHAEAFATVPQCRVVGIASASGSTARALAVRVGVELAGDDWRSLFARVDPHACVVAVSHAHNEQITREVLERDCHVLAEKPVAFSSGAVAALAAMAREKRLIAVAAMNRRYYAGVLSAIESVRYAGRLVGMTVFAPEPVRPRRAKAKHAGFVYDRWTVAQTLHLIDLIRLAGGDVVEVLASHASTGADAETNLTTMFRLSSGATAVYVAASSSPGEWELRLHGEGVEARLSPLERGTIRVGNAPWRSLPDAEREAGGHKPGLLAQAAAFADMIRHHRTFYPASDLADHGRSIALAETIEQLSQVKA